MRSEDSPAPALHCRGVGRLPGTPDTGTGLGRETLIPGSGPKQFEANQQRIKLHGSHQANIMRHILLFAVLSLLVWFTQGKMKTLK